MKIVDKIDIFLKVAASDPVEMPAIRSPAKKNVQWPGWKQPNLVDKLVLAILDQLPQPREN